MEGERSCPNRGASIQQTQTDYTTSQTDHPTPGQSSSGYDQGGYQQPPPHPVTVPKKRPGVARVIGLIVGLFLWGIGQIYVGRIMRGIVFLIVGIVFVPALYGIAFMGVVATGGMG